MDHSGPRQPFWLDGRFIRDYVKKHNGSLTSPTKLSERFIWTDGSKMEYRNWNKNSNPRNCSGSNCPLGEPQDSPTKLCLHGAVDSLGKGKEPRPPLNALGGNIEGKGQGKGKGEGRWPTQGDCYTWGNQEECSKPMAFVCKKRRFPCLGKAKTHQQQFQPKTL